MILPPAIITDRYPTAEEEKLADEAKMYYKKIITLKGYHFKLKHDKTKRCNC